MREILFKAKRKDNGQWIDGFLFRSWERAYILWGTTNGIPDMIEVVPETVAQFTNQTDKNNKKIFEGDILSRSGFWKIRINYENGCFMVRNSDPVQYVNLITNSPLCNFQEISNYEVIGNIYDNPELLVP